jgi:hypothetical protein
MQYIQKEEFLTDMKSADDNLGPNVKISDEADILWLISDVSFEDITLSSGVRMGIGDDPEIPLLKVKWEDVDSRCKFRVMDREDLFEATEQILLSADVRNSGDGFTLECEWSYKGKDITFNIEFYEELFSETTIIVAFQRLSGDETVFNRFFYTFKRTLQGTYKLNLE